MFLQFNKIIFVSLVMFNWPAVEDEEYLVFLSILSILFQVLFCYVFSSLFLSLDRIFGFT